jgi:O-antigen/teichoic acid export membrane protein
LKKLIKQLAGESIIYGMSSVVTKFIGVFLVPFYTSVFTPADYGVLNIVNSFFFFFGILVVFALDNSAARWYYDTDDVEDQKNTIASWFYFQLIMSFLVFILIFLFSKVLAKIILNNEQSDFFIYPALSLLFTILPGIVANWLRMQRKALQTVFFSIGLSLITITLTIYFVLILKKGILGIIYANLIANIVASIYVILILRKWLLPRYFDFLRLKLMLKYALPLIPTTVAFWVLNNSSAFVIQYFYNQSEVGLYQLGMTIASGVAIFVTAFQMAWGPFAFSIIKNENAKNTYAMMLNVYSIFFTSIALLIALFSLEILKIFTNKSYYGAAIVAGILSFNGIIYGYSYILGIGNNIEKNNKPLAISVFFGAIITFILYLILVPLIGKEGAAISTTLGYIVVPIFVYKKAQKVYKIEFNVNLTIFISIIGICIYSISLFFESNNILMIILLKLLLIFIYFAIVFLLIKKFDENLYKKINSIFSRFFSTKY